MSFLDSFTASMSGTDIAGLNSISTGARQALDLNAAGGALDSFGAGFGAIQHLMFGLHAQKAAEFRAQQLNINAGQAEAAAQRSAIDVQRQTDMLTSRALAVAAASGGGASDPTVINIIANDAAQGAYLKQTALYQGADRARLMRMEADAAMYEGANARLNATMESGALLVKGASNLLASKARGASLFQRFGGNGPT